MFDSVVLTGAAMKGAFTAGSLSVLTSADVVAEHEIDIREVLGASSGAVNGAYLATSIRQGLEVGSGERLSRVWIDDVTAWNLFSVSWRGILGLRGLFDMTSMLSVMRKRLTAKPGVNRVWLGMSLTDLRGGRSGTGLSYEDNATFADKDFDDESGLERVRTATAASASVPLLFTPMRVTVGGAELDAVDGGTVDDTPLQWALANEQVRRIFVIVPYPERPSPTRLYGLALAERLLHIVIQQRLVRDLEAARASGKVIVEIRPDVDLPGGDFSAAFSKSMRERYVAAGVRAARLALSGTK